MKLIPVPEAVVLELERQHPGGAASEVLKEAAEIKAKGHAVRYYCTEKGDLCVQEGVVFLSTQPQ